jgi:hypothetical protein
LARAIVITFYNKQKEQQVHKESKRASSATKTAMLKQLSAYKSVMPSVFRNSTIALYIMNDGEINCSVFLSLENSGCAKLSSGNL